MITDRISVGGNAIASVRLPDISKPVTVNLQQWTVIAPHAVGVNPLDQLNLEIYINAVQESCSRCSLPPVRSLSHDLIGYPESCRPVRGIRRWREHAPYAKSLTIAVSSPSLTG